MAAQKTRSAFCRKPDRRAGFTLIEVMVVLALIAALLAIALPQFVRLYTRVRVAFERRDLEHQLFELPQRVRAAGRAGVLAAPQTPRAALLHDADPLGLQRPLRLRLHLPRGWRVKVPKPIFYHFTGACDGGVVVLSLPPVSLRYVLTSPLCRPRLAQSG